ncbi:MAG: hypothetical protein ABIK31_00365 [candidate division WOR-3 bacterium]
MGVGDKYHGYVDNPGYVVSGAYFLGSGISNPLFEIKDIMNRSLNMTQLSKVSDVFVRLSESIGGDFSKNILKLIRQFFNKKEFKNFVVNKVNGGSSVEEAVKDLFMTVIFTEDSPYLVEFQNMLAVYQLEWDKYYRILDSLIAKVRSIVAKDETNFNSINVNTSNPYTPSLLLAFLEERGKILLLSTYSELYSLGVVSHYLVRNLDKVANVFGYVIHK